MGERNIKFKEFDKDRKFHAENKISDIQVFQ